MNSTNVQITAGLGGFIVLFALAVVIMFLTRDMTKRLRRLSQDESEWPAQERAAVQASETTSPDDAEAPRG